PARTYSPSLHDALPISDNHDVTRSLQGACEHRAQHDRVRASSQSLSNVTGVLHAAVCNQRHARSRSHGSCFHDRGNLWCTNTSNHTGGADRTSTNTHLDGVCASLNHRLCCRACCQVAADNINLGAEVILDARDHFQHAVIVRVCGVDNENVHAGIDKQACTLIRLLAGTNTCCS